MNAYSIDWYALADNMLPTDVRKPLVQAFAHILSLPTGVIHSSFMTFKDECLYRVRHNSQICYMEAVLNDKFDSFLRRIRIVNTVFREPIYFYEPEDNKEVYFYEGTPVYFREAEDFAGDGVDFVVCVPPSLRPVVESTELHFVTRMKGQIEYYKLYSKNYKIAWVQVND